MFSDLVLIQQIYRDSRPLLLPYISEEELIKLDNELAERVENCKPVVMVYGVYNAGKSTFINALAGEVVAEMDDIPLTNKVTRYPFAHYEIIDTPGIDAPVEHEMVTRAQLLHADSVIFMLSSDGVFDELATYAEIYRILEAGKPLLIVINNKSGYSEGDVEYSAIVDKIKHNLYHQASPELRDSALNVPVWLVNAKSALKAKLENKSALLARSNIQALEREVQRLFMETDKAVIMNTFKGLIRHEIENALFQLDGLRQEGEVKNLTKLLTRIDATRQTLLAKTERKIRSTKGRTRDEVYQLLLNQQVDSVAGVLEQWQDQNVDYFQQELAGALAEIGQQAEKLISDIPRFSGERLNGSSAFGGDGQSFFNLSDLVQFGRKLKFDDQVLKEGMVGAMKLGKNYFPQLFKGIGPKTMEKYAAKVVPFIGPAIDLMVGIYDFYQAKSAEEKQMEEKRLYMQRISEQSTQLVTDVQDAILEMYSEIVREIFMPLLNQIQDELDSLEGSTAENGRITQRLLSLQHALA